MCTVVTLMHDVLIPSGCVLADVRVGSSRKLFIRIVQQNACRIKDIYSFLKQNRSLVLSDIQAYFPKLNLFIRAADDSSTHDQCSVVCFDDDNQMTIPRTYL